ncbi:MAG: type III pantothenate kinase [Bacteroidales bacterium]|nr:type III pantothenate kinase [Bacteroidales bacterium]
MNEVLTIDIGNTKAKYAVFHDKNIVESHVFNPLSDDLTLLLQRYPIINKGIISSVGGKISECLAQLKSIKMLVLSNETKLPFTLTYKEKSKIGADRLALVAAAFAEKPHQNSLIIDIGTCITYDILTDDDHHLGGPISPGMQLRFKAMHEHTALLPLCEPTTDELKIVCDDTIECLQSGVQLGVLHEIKEFIELYSLKFNNLNVFISGGDNIFLQNKLKSCTFASSNFMFNGLKFILEYNDIQ